MKFLIWGLCSSSSLYSVKLVLLTVPLVVASGFMGLEFQLGFMELFFLEVLLGSNSTSSVSSEEGSGAQLDEIDWRSRLVGGIIRGQEEEDISGEPVRLKTVLWYVYITQFICGSYMCVCVIVCLVLCLILGK